MTWAVQDFTFPHSVGMKKKDALCEAQNWRCCYCGIHLQGRGDDMDAPSIEHIIPLCLGGFRLWVNEAIACRLCNSSRHKMPWERFLALVTRHGRQKAALIAQQAQSIAVRREQEYTQSRTTGDPTSFRVA
jgi:hypothetical protein